jgi:hypothetical protein
VTDAFSTFGAKLAADLGAIASLRDEPRGW